MTVQQEENGAGMGIFKNMFEKKIFTETKLYNFLKEICPGETEYVYNSVKPEFKFTIALSMIILRITHAFCNGLIKEVNTISKQMKIAPNKLNYDVMAFEVAAYCHYWLLKDFPKIDDDDYDDFDFDEDDYDYDYDYEDDELVDDSSNNDEMKIYEEELYTSLHVTNEFLLKHINFEINDIFFVKRANSYLFWIALKKATVQEVASIFNSVLIASIIKGAPSIIKKDKPIGGSPLETAVMIQSNISHQFALPELTETVKRIYKLSST